MFLRGPDRPRAWWRNSKKYDSREKSEDLAGGTPLSMPGAKRRRISFCCCCLAQLLAQPGARNTSSAQARHAWGFTGEGSPAAITRSLCQHLLFSHPSGLSSHSCHHQVMALPMSPPAMPLTRPRAAVGPPAPLDPHISTAPGTSPAPTAMERRKQVPTRKWGAEAACPNTPKEIRILNGTVLSHQGSVLTRSVGETHTAIK